jgi:hypothetical protein
MNTRPVSALILATALSVSASIPLFAASKNDLPVSINVRTLVATSGGGVQIERGMSRWDVSYAMRYNFREELSPDVWVYTGFRANVDSPAAQDCKTVVITFAHNRVSNLQLVNKPAVDVIAANLKLGSSATNVASK